MEGQGIHERNVSKAKIQKIKDLNNNNNNHNKGIKNNKSKNKSNGSLWLNLSVLQVIVVIVTGVLLYLFLLQILFSHIDDFIHRPSSSHFYTISGDHHQLYMKCISSFESKESKSKLRYSSPTTQNLTILLESGLPFTSLSFQSLLSSQNLQNLFRSYPHINFRVCSYDRSGYGWSSPSSLPRNLTNLVTDLSSLVSVAKLPPPYLFVGWSFGGTIGRLFSLQHLSNMTGLVLVDSNFYLQSERMPGFQNLLTLGINSFNIARWLVPIGIVRIAGWLDLWPQDAGRGVKGGHEARVVFSSNNFCETAYRELLSFKANDEIETSQGMGNEYRLRDLQIKTIISKTAGESWVELQKKYNGVQGKLSRDVEEMMVECGHYIPDECSDTIIRAITKIVQGNTKKNHK